MTCSPNYGKLPAEFREKAYRSEPHFPALESRAPTLETPKMTPRPRNRHRLIILAEFLSIRP